MAYSTANPPALTSQRVGTNGGAQWVYNSADAATVVRVDGYISDGEALGMKVGDFVFQTSPAATVGHIYLVKSVHATNGSVDLTDGTAIVATDTD
jgi:hypothetical protein